VEKTYKLPGAHALSYNTATGATSLNDSNGNSKGSLNIVADTSNSGISVSSNAEDSKDVTYTIKHNSYDVEIINNETAEELHYGTENDEGFTVVTGVTPTTDGTGHLASITTQKYKLPRLKTYKIKDEVTTENNTAKIVTILADNDDNSTSTVLKVNSNTLKVTSTTTYDEQNPDNKIEDTINVELVWGSF
jgi:hypothetical protein